MLGDNCAHRRASAGRIRSPRRQFGECGWTLRAELDKSCIGPALEETGAKKLKVTLTEDNPLNANLEMQVVAHTAEWPTGEAIVGAGRLCGPPTAPPRTRRGLGDAVGLEYRRERGGSSRSAMDFERAYRMYSRRVYSKCLHMVRNEAEAEDLTQEVFLHEGYGHREIARILGLSIGTSKSQLYKARVRLRQLLCAGKSKPLRGAACRPPRRVAAGAGRRSRRSPHARLAGPCG
jgi:hypothetical protein